MIKLRESASRGHMCFDWLTSYHSFSFGNYFDPAYMGFSDLRVINEDYIKANKGFGTHPHKNMEIITFLIDGELEHRDTMNNSEIITKGEIQVMSAGSGVEHSEFNPSKNKPTHLLQIWITPKSENTVPRYDQKKIKNVNDELQLLVSGFSEDDGEAISINQDARIYHGCFMSNFEQALDEQRSYWIQVISGKGKVNTLDVSAGDAVEFSYEKSLNLEIDDKLEVLVFDLNNRI